MQGALPPDPTILVFTNIKQAYTVTVDKATSPILEGPAGYSPIRGPNFANAECEALLRRISLDSDLQAPMKGQNIRDGT